MYIVLRESIYMYVHVTHYSGVLQPVTPVKTFVEMLYTLVHISPNPVTGILVLPRF